MMPTRKHTPERSPGDRVYAALLWLYPAAFRVRFGADMVDFFRDRRRAARRSAGTLGAARAWAHGVVDVVVGAALEHARAMAPRHGRRTAREDTDDPTLETRNEDMLATLGGDIRYALRGIWTRRGFSAVVLGTLALGIGATVAIFSVVNGVLLRALPYPDADRIVHVEHNQPYTLISEPEFVDYRSGTRRFEALAAFTDAAATISGEGEPERVTVGRVSDGFFQVLSVPAAIGRTFVAEEERRHAGQRRVVVLSHGLWTRRFGGDPSIVGRGIRVNDITMTVVGVMPQRFAIPSAETDIWTPMRLNYDTLWTRNNHYLTLLGKLARGATAAGVAAELSTLAKQFVRDYPAMYNPKDRLSVAVTPLREVIVGRTEPYLVALLGAVAFVLLIACVNVANLLLARGEARRKELAIRTALGASRGRLVRQALTESVVYATAGGVLGVGLAWWGVRVLRAVAPPSIPRIDQVGIDGRVLAFALVVTALTGVLFGLLPALRGSRGDALPSLKLGGKTSSQFGAGHARGVLVVSEVALAVVLLTGAGLLVRSLWMLQAIDLGIRPEGVLTMRVSFPERAAAINDPVGQQHAIVQFYRDLVARVRALPGVRSVGAVGDLPISDGFSSWSILIDGAPMTSVSEAPSATPQQVTPGYFATMGMTVLRGREFTTEDRDEAPPVAMVNETMARTMWPGKNAIGGTLKMLNETAPWVTVVGVVKDVKQAGYQSEVPPTMYFPHAQAGRSAYYVPAGMNLVVKVDGDPMSVAGPTREVIRRLSPVTPVSQIRTMESVVASSVASRRFSTSLLAGFAIVALVLAGIGIYGVIAYDVSQRTHEIGLRMALGARSGQVAGLMVVRGVRLVALGVVIGVAGSIAVTGTLQALLVGVNRVDPVTLAGVVAALAIVAASAAWLPARRASAVDPMVALRRD